MTPSDRAQLTNALRDHVRTIAADLRAQMRASGDTRVRAQQLHADEKVAEDFDVWTDLLSRRAAVLWVLKSVYVRVLEDRGLLTPGRLLDQEAQQLFERLAPHLGETAFLRWVYRDLASSHGGLPELFSLQPAEVALPSDEFSRALIAFWRHHDADTGATWGFAEERFEGELMGDLYQELDPVVKDRFALCQTPDFVRAFILDRTLTPAIETFGPDEVRLLDPACGSGHFLIDGLKRLVAATAAKHTDWDRGEVVAHALERVVGVDLNDYACALARARLIMTSAELAGVTSLADAARFHPHVYWADGLEQVEREEHPPSLQYALFEKVEETPRATLTRSDVRAALKKIFEKRFHAVVANPPYIPESDERRKKYHREQVGKTRRYVSAYRQYSLASPFTERCFQLAERGAYIGIIASNNFMKRDFGKPLIEQVLRGLDVSLIVDSSQAYIPFHGTPTVLLFGRNRRPEGDVVRVVMSKRGETGTPVDPAKGQVWSSIAEGWNRVGFENEFVSVADLPRATLDKHPWSLGGGGAAELKQQIESCQHTTLGQVRKDIGRTNVCGEDPVFIMSPEEADRLGVRSLIKPLTIGEVVRDWSIQASQFVLYPYESMGGRPIADNHPSVARHFWRFRTLLKGRTVFGKSIEERGGAWFEHLEHYTNRLHTPFSIAFACVATHNHFVLDRGGKVFKQSAPVIKLPSSATEEEHLALLGLLNSSVACFWMKQVCHNKGGGTDTGKMQSDPAKVAHDFAPSVLEKMPIPDLGRSRGLILEVARRLDQLASQRATVLAQALPEIGALFPLPVSDLRTRIAEAQLHEETLLNLQIAFQEELDWLVYRVFGLVGDESVANPVPWEDTSGIPIGARPFEILQARRGREKGVDSQSLARGLPLGTDLRVARVWATRISAIESSAVLQLIEHESYKRRWLLTPKHLAGRVETFEDRVEVRLRVLMADLVEATARKRVVPFEIGRIAVDLQEEPVFNMLAELLTGRPDYSPEHLLRDIVADEAVPNHPTHRYSTTGLVKHAAWERTWEDQRREDLGEDVAPTVPPTYSQPDFVSRRVFELRGKLDVPKERFIAFTEIPGRAPAETLYGWAGWTAIQRLKAILSVDEELEDARVPFAARVGLLESAWHLLPDVAREDAASAARLKAELQAVVGPEGLSRELIEDWRKAYPAPNTHAGRAKRATVARRDEGECDESES